MVRQVPFPRACRGGLRDRRRGGRHETPRPAARRRARTRPRRASAAASRRARARPPAAARRARRPAPAARSRRGSRAARRRSTCGSRSSAASRTASRSSTRSSTSVRSAPSPSAERSRTTSTAAKASKSAKAAPITVNQDILRAVGLVRTLNKPLKILGAGELSVPLFVVADAFTASAREKIEAAGGVVNVLEVPTTAMPALGVEGGEEPEAQAAARSDSTTADAASPEADDGRGSSRPTGRSGRTPAPNGRPRGRPGHP